MEAATDSTAETGEIERAEPDDLEDGEIGAEVRFCSRWRAPRCFGARQAAAVEPRRPVPRRCLWPCAPSLLVAGAAAGRSSPRRCGAKRGVRRPEISWKGSVGWPVIRPGPFSPSFPRRRARQRTARSLSKMAKLTQVAPPTTVRLAAAACRYRCGCPCRDRTAPAPKAARLETRLVSDCRPCCRSPSGWCAEPGLVIPAAAVT